MNVTVTRHVVNSQV